MIKSFDLVNNVKLCLNLLELQKMTNYYKPIIHIGLFEIQFTWPTTLATFTIIVLFSKKLLI
jgi:hypothetical protein